MALLAFPALNSKPNRMPALLPACLLWKGTCQHRRLLTQAAYP